MRILVAGSRPIMLFLPEFRNMIPRVKSMGGILKFWLRKVWVSWHLLYQVWLAPVAGAVASVNWLIARLWGRSITWFVARASAFWAQTVHTMDWSIAWLVNGLVAWSMHWFVSWFMFWLIARLVYRSITWSVDWLVARFVGLIHVFLMNWFDFVNITSLVAMGRSFRMSI